MRNQGLGQQSGREDAHASRLRRARVVDIRPSQHPHPPASGATEGHRACPDCSTDGRAPQPQRPLAPGRADQVSSDRPARVGHDRTCPYEPPIYELGAKRGHAHRPLSPPRLGQLRRRPAPLQGDEKRHEEADVTSCLQRSPQIGSHDPSCLHQRRRVATLRSEGLGEGLSLDPVRVLEQVRVAGRD